MQSPRTAEIEGVQTAWLSLARQSAASGSVPGGTPASSFPVPWLTALLHLVGWGQLQPAALDRVGRAARHHWALPHGWGPRRLSKRDDAITLQQKVVLCTKIELSHTNLCLATCNWGSWREILCNICHRKCYANPVYGFLNLALGYEDE